jgi:hypothetical protein
MLSIQAIQQLAKEHSLKLTAHYPQTSTEGIEPPAPRSLTVWFREEAVDAWEPLMTQLTEVPVSIYGTRTVTGSGATDDQLYPAYKARLPHVNATRKLIGLEPVFA